MATCHDLHATDVSAIFIYIYIYWCVFFRGFSSWFGLINGHQRKNRKLGGKAHPFFETHSISWSKPGLSSWTLVTLWWQTTSLGASLGQTNRSEASLFAFSSVPELGPPARCSSLPFLGEGSPTKTDYRKEEGTLILTSQIWKS